LIIVTEDARAAEKFLSDAGKKNGLYWPTAEGEPPDSDVIGRRLGGDDRFIPCGKSILQEIHSLDHASNIFGHRAHGIEVFRIDRKHAIEGHEAESRLQTHHAATSRGDADGAGGIRAKGDVGLPTGHGARRATR